MPIDKFRCKYMIIADILNMKNTFLIHIILHAAWGMQDNIFCCKLYANIFILSIRRRLHGLTKENFSNVTLHMTPNLIAHRTIILETRGYCIWYTHLSVISSTNTYDNIWYLTTERKGKGVSFKRFTICKLIEHIFYAQLLRYWVKGGQNLI